MATYCTEFILFFGFVATCAAQSDPRASRFRTDTGMVLIPITVTDHNGKTVEGLRRENFTVFDEKLSQPIVSFTSEETAASIGLVLDLSGSMRGALNDLKEVVHEFLTASNPEDEVFLLTVSDEPALVSSFTSDFAQLEDKIRYARAGGATALIDTIYLAVGKMHNAQRQRRALFVISDGMDNHSHYSKPELMQAALEADTQIYTLAIENAPTNTRAIAFTEQRLGWNFLQQLSERTGGINTRIRGVSAGKDAARKTAQAIRSQYVIGYNAPGTSHAEKWHHIRVKVDMPQISISARTGYYSR